MLRRPSTYHPTRLGEGCSSAAFDPSKYFKEIGWNNLTNRGSISSKYFEGSAVPRAFREPG